MDMKRAIEYARMLDGFRHQIAYRGVLAIERIAETSKEVAQILSSIPWEVKIDFGLRQNTRGYLYPGDVIEFEKMLAGKLAQLVAMGNDYIAACREKYPNMPVPSWYSIKLPSVPLDDIDSHDRKYRVECDDYEIVPNPEINADIEIYTELGRLAVYKYYNDKDKLIVAMPVVKHTPGVRITYMGFPPLKYPLNVPGELLLLVPEMYEKHKHIIKEILDKKVDTPHALYERMCAQIGGVRR